MRNLTLLFAALLISMAANSQSLAPEVFASSGDYFTGANIKLNWTLGEMVTETYTSSGNFLTQGFHQSNYEVAAIDETEENNLIVVYPNPFTDMLLVNTGNLKGLNLMVHDLQGKNLMEKNIKKSNVQLDFSAFSPGIYFIKVCKNEKIIKTFKVQKINN